MAVGFLMIAAADYVTGSVDFAAAPTAQAQDIRSQYAPPLPAAV
jgi:hypothetical protein